MNTSTRSVNPLPTRNGPRVSAQDAPQSAPHRALAFVCALLLLGSSVSAALSLVDEAFPKPANAAERAQLEFDLSKHPTPVEIAWTRTGGYGFMHFGISTAGVGKMENFNPTQLDCHQWIRAYKAAGCKIVILTTKHHDGFCLWNSRYTKHSVAGSPWKNGKADVIREFVNACREEGIQAGLYISTADGSQRKGRGFGDTYDNGSPAVESVIPTPVEGRPFPAGHKEFKLTVDDYNRFTLNQLYELVTEYGPIAQIWFDAPVPPPGIGQKYNNDVWHNMVRELSPDTVLLGYSGGGVKRKPGDWTPPDGIMSIMPSWFDHTDEDAKLSPSQYVARQFLSRFASGNVLAPGVAPDRTGLIPAASVKILEKTGTILRQTLGTQAFSLWNDGKPNPLNRAEGAPPELLDNNEATVWTPAAYGPCEVSFKAKAESNLFLIEEEVSQGQRIRGCTLEKKAGNQWEKLFTEERIGIRRVIPIPTVEAGTQLRFRVTSSKAKPRLAELGLFFSDPVLMPSIHRGADDRVVIEGRADAVIHYTLDGSEPTARSPVYTEPVAFPQGGLVRAVCIKGETVSDCASFEVGLSKKKWKVVACNNEEPDAPVSAILDDDLSTEWHSAKGEKGAPVDSEINGEIKAAWGAKSPNAKEKPAQFLVLDLGEIRTVTGMTYYPGKKDAKWGVSDGFTLCASDAHAKFGRPSASVHLCYGDDDRRQHVCHFANPVTGRYIRIDITGCGAGFAAADLGVLGK